MILPMFGFKKRAEERQQAAQAKAKEAVRIAEAEAFGRQVAASINTDVDQFIAVRARPIGENVYNVFSRIITKPLEEGENPIDQIRIHSQIFIEQLNRYKDQMISESEVALADSLRIAEKVDLAPVVRHRIAEAINTIWLQLFERSVDQAGDLIQVLRAQGLTAEVTAHYDKPKATP